MKFLDVEQGKMVDVSLEEFCERMGIKPPEPEKENTMKDPFGMMDAITAAADRETKRLQDEAEAAQDGPRYPDVVCELVGQDGNALNLLAIVNRALKSYGIEKDEREEFMAEAMAGDYDHLLQTCMKWVTVA